jgi:leucyl aminopeptidase
VILEALRVLAENTYRPQNTLEFHFYGGEEGGLLGSQAIFSKYKSDRKNVLAFVNQDMAGYSPSGKISVYDDYSDAGLVAYVKKNVVAYGGGSFTTDKCGYGKQPNPRHTPRRSLSLKRAPSLQMPHLTSGELETLRSINISN